MLIVHLTADLLDLVAGAVSLVPLADEAPADEDVKAGWTAFAIFLALGAAVAFLGWSLTKQLKKADASEEAGLYDPSDKPKRQTRVPREGEATDGDR